MSPEKDQEDSTYWIATSANKVIDIKTDINNIIDNLRRESLIDGVSITKIHIAGCIKDSFGENIPGIEYQITTKDGSIKRQILDLSTGKVFPLEETDKK